MSAFDVAFANLLGNEGGYVNNPADPGGETNWGITKRVAERWGYKGDMKSLPQATAAGIAKACYWDPYQCDQLPVAIAFQVMDAAYNGGHPAQWLQQSLGVTADGSIGAQTIAAARGCNVWQVIACFNSWRLSYYTSLGTFGTFGKGWTNRVAANLKKGSM